MADAARAAKAGGTAGGFAVPLPITTERLTLRLPVPADVPAMLAYRSLPEVCRYLPFPPMDAAEIRRRMREQWGERRLAVDGDAVTVVLARRDDGAVVGDAVLFLRSSADAGGEVGWVLDPGRRGLGYATEAAAALLDVAFGPAGLHRVIAQMHPDNAASERVAARLGMRREALHRADARVRGQWQDTLVLALLEDEWSGVRPRTPVRSPGT